MELKLRAREFYINANMSFFFIRTTNKNR